MEAVMTLSKEYLFILEQLSELEDSLPLCERVK